MTNTKNVAGSRNAPVKPKKRRAASLDRRKARAGWVFVMPFVIGLILIYLPVMFDSIQFSFSQLNNLQGGGYTLTFIGFENYQKALFEDASFVQVLVSGLQTLAFEIPAIVIFSLFMAVLLNQKMIGRGAFRAIFFIPVIISTGIMEGIATYDQSMDAGINDGSGENATEGIVNAMDIQMLFANMKVGQELVVYVTQMINNIYNIVNRSGVQMLIFLAGLQSISPAIYESCSIDGATAWETFWKITLPMISPMILVNTIYTIIDSFTSSKNAVMAYISSQSGQVNGQVVGTAMSWIYFLIVAIILAAIAGIMSAFVFYQKKN